MSKQSRIKNHYYIDGFAGAGYHISKDTSELIPGSPTNALSIEPPFDEYHFIDLDGGKTQLLKEISKLSPNAHVYEGDCNKILVKDIFPLVKYEDYNRALCVLDPYGLHLNWEVIYNAGKSGTIEIFLNFPLMDMHMNVFWNDPNKVEQRQIKRMNKFWGDESWREAVYEKQQGLFETFEEKKTSGTIAEAFRERLKETAGFNYVPEPIPMRNTNGSTVYYLFFASPNETGGKIVKQIFDKYRDRGLV